MLFIISQILVGISLLIVILSILSKSKENILFYRIPNILLYALSFALQGLWVAFGNLKFGFVRYMVYYVFKIKGKKPNISVLITFLTGLIIINIITWSGPLGLLPMISGLLLVWAFWQDKETFTRISLLIATSLWIIYNTIVSNYMGIITEGFIQIFQITAFVRYDILKKESLIKKERVVKK